jgi:Holliday junction resolvase RusA-like endonuclease
MEAESSGIPGKGTGGRHVIYKYIIPLPPVTKKNSQRILVNRKTGIPFIAPSSAYKRYEEQAIYFLTPKPKTPLAGRYRVAAVFYMPTRRRVDLTNLLEAAHDTLVAAKILADDNNTIIASVDGSRVLYDKENPRTEIIIQELMNHENRSTYGE